MSRGFSFHSRIIPPFFTGGWCFPCDGELVSKKWTHVSNHSFRCLCFGTSHSFSCVSSNKASLNQLLRASRYAHIHSHTHERACTHSQRARTYTDTETHVHGQPESHLNRERKKKNHYQPFSETDSWRGKTVPAQNAQGFFFYRFY